MNSSLSTKEKILYGIDIKEMLGLEIGPLASPLVKKSEGDIFYVDRADTEEIKNWYSKAQNLNFDNIVPVDFVWGDQSLAETTGHHLHFDYCIAAHVIEHVPDLVGWLEEISAVLKPHGIAAFSVPDRRYTFDYLRQESTPADVIEAFLLRRRKPSIRHIFDHFSSFAEIDVADAWTTGFDGSTLQPAKTLKEVLTICSDARDHDRYIDSHCWVFTSQSFIQLLTALNQMGLINFKINRFFDVEENNHEFVIQLEKLPPELDDIEKQSIFQKSLEKAKPHKLTIEFEANNYGMAQVYYDTGAGFNERESIVQSVTDRGRKMKLEFNMPPMAIKAIRFDPLMSQVNVRIYNISLQPFSGSPHLIPLENLEPGDNIRVCGIKNQYFFAKSRRRTIDPSIHIRFPHSLNGKL